MGSMRGLATVMWKLSIEDDQGVTTVVHLARSEYTLGRGEENTVRLTERNISRRHARLVKQGGNWFLVDLGSYNGCFVNGIRAGESHPVGPRDLIQLGDYRLEIITDETPTQVAADVRNDTLNSGIPGPLSTSSKDRFVMVVGPTPGREYVLTDGRQTLGRGDSCDITVNHASVSRVHAEIHYLKDNCYEIIDKKSSNGLRINGVELRQGLVEARDVVEFGDVVLKFIPAGQIYRPTPDETLKLAALLGVGENTDVLSHSMRLKLAWSSMSRSVRWGVTVLSCLVVLMFAAVVATGRTSRAVGMLHIGAYPPNPNVQLLQEAKELATAEKYEEAHSQLLKIPANAPQRRDRAFNEIEGQWADALFERAARATTSEEKRAIFDTLVNESSLDVTRHAKAQDMLANLHNNVLAVDELPKTKSAHIINSAIGATNPNGTRDNHGTGSTISAESRDATSAASLTANNGRSAQPKSSPMAVSPAAQSRNDSTESSISMELVQERAKKNALRAKVAAGTATDQERRLLRALCRQLNDTSCSR